MAIIRGRQMGLDMPTLAKQFNTSKSVTWAALNTPNRSETTGKYLKTLSGDDRITVRMSVQGHCKKTSAPRETLQKAPSEQANDSGEEPFSSTEVGKGSSVLEWNKVPTVKHCGGNVMVWGCFHANGVVPLIRITEIMNRYMYKDILEKEMLPYGRFQVSRGWLFQQDNDPKHTSHFVNDLFAQRQGIEVLGKRLNNKTTEKLCREVRATQGRMDQDPTSDPDEFDRVHAKRCEPFIKAKGMATKY
uniref:Uncharacterized protein n=1 Tax=Caenorhabditis japonica TaxID=281687 RepID=A0A8R1I425_CAEJA